MKRKKRIVIFSVIVGSFVLLILLSSAIFSFKAVSVECRTSTMYLSSLDYEGMINAGEFRYGKNILFIDFEENAEKIEKKYPYVKVLNIERKFPNYAVVNIKERIPAGRIASNSGFYCLDEELKVLNNVSKSSEYNTVTAEEKTPLYIVGESYSLDYDKSLSVGDMINDSKLKYFVSSFYNGAVTTDYIGDVETALSCISIIESITIEYEAVFDRVKFNVKFAGSDSRAEIYDNDNLTDSIYKITKLYIANGSKYTLYRSSVDGVITTL